MSVDNASPARSGTLWRVEMMGGLRAVRVTPQESTGDGAVRLPAESVEQFRTHKTALLLARLALQPHRTHGREELADLFWPDAPVERGRANITQTLVYLRQALLEPRAGGLFFADHKTIRVTRCYLETDVAEWEAGAKRALAASSATDQSDLLSSAIAGYPGELLPGFYDDWVCEERLRLSTLFEALQQRLQALRVMEVPIEKLRPTSVAASPRQAAALVNAPRYLTRFFGREAESAKVSRQLGQAHPVRLLTLLGTGGIGKTRLALEVAERVLTLESDARSSAGSFGWAAFVPLAEARTGAQMEAVLLSVIGLEGGGTDGLAAVVSYLNSRAALGAERLLLVLDNLEQLGESSARVVSRLLSEVPSLSILATSRQPVRIAGEQEIPIGALPSGASETGTSTSAGVRLFVDRARLMRPDYALTPANEPEIVRLCMLLEGVPLALELAAAWARVLTPPQITERLNDRFALLVSRQADIGLNRHRSLHAAIAWSYDLLEPSLQALFVQLSVFRSGWTFEAAQAVTKADTLHESLMMLTERSLIVIDESARGDESLIRFRMLESLREFADAQLSSGERNSLYLSHARYFDELSQRAVQPELLKSRNMHALLEGERDNLRTAVTTSLATSSDVTDAAVADDLRVHGIRILLQSVWIWTPIESDQLHSLASAALPLLPKTTRSALEASVLFQQGSVALGMGNLESAGRRLHESLTLFEAHGDRRGAVGAKGRLANLACQSGDTSKAMASWTECVEDARALGDGRLEAAMLNNLGIFCPNLDERRKFVEQAVALDRIYVPNSLFLACTLNTLGNVARELGDFQTAQQSFEEASDLASADGSTGTSALVQTSLVELFLETGEHLDRAAALLCDASQFYERSGELPLLAEVFYLQFRVALARGDATDAFAFASKNLRFSHENCLTTPLLSKVQASLPIQLRSEGYGDLAKRLDALLSRYRRTDLEGAHTITR